ncbi:MAG: YdiU family protein [Sphingomonadales bacterium]|nr:YdiU family protein [Sphingomonadales bacterium]MDE2169216.1 YdiU family protein [Sphingomonadales bacterium]
MRPEPQASPYTPDPRIAEIADWLGNRVEAARFPSHRLRWRDRRHDATIGLDNLDDEAWLRHFGHFEPLPGNLPRPLALRYHGHQFRVYNPQLGDGRGFLFAQMRDGAGRLMDLGTKGSGTTPWSRQGDGRLTLKGAMREILATEMLEALGANTSKTLSVVETGEELERGDEPSPTRSAVLTRLSHGHIRIGSFQRLMALEEDAHLAALVDYALAQYPGPPPPEGAPDAGNPAIVLLHQVVARMADMAASYVASGFVHGVLNTDNMNITGESFDYGPWRWLPRWDAGFTAAYFDHSGLYAFGRQAEAIRWNCGQLAVALRPMAETAPLVAALERFEPLFQRRLATRVLWRLGVESLGDEADAALLHATGKALGESGQRPDSFFHTHRGGRRAEGDFGDLVARHAPLAGALDHPLWDEDDIVTNHIDEVERIWSAIDQRDDWQPLHDHVARIRQLGQALGPAPEPIGHLPG